MLYHIWNYFLVIVHRPVLEMKLYVSGTGLVSILRINMWLTPIELCQTDKSVLNIWA
jgi:hypothetical protein